MPNPEVNVHESTHRSVFVLCPIDGCGVYIARDRIAWQVHMEADHSANSSTWDIVDVELGAQHGPFDEYVAVRWAQTCYGCENTYSTKAELVTHLSGVHSAS